MNLTSKEALKLLEEAQKLNPGRWINHSKKVGEAAARIADKLHLDSDKARAMGYIHDIGKRFGKKAVHTVEGYEFIKSLSYDLEYANICLTHSYLNNDINCTAGGYPSPKYKGYEFRKKFIQNHKYTIYDKIINICDLFCTNEFVTIDRRLLDVYTRLGVYDNTVYHIKETTELKRELENKMGCGLYSLFPEIVENFNKKHKNLYHEFKNH